MSIFDRILGSNKKEITELKKDLDAVVQFSAMQSIDEKTLQLMSSTSFDSSSFDDNLLIKLWSEVPEISTVLSKITDRAKSVPWRHYKVKDKQSTDKFNKATIDYTLGRCSYSELIQLREKSFEPTFDAQAAKLLTNPNSLQSWGEMIEQLLTYYYVIGDGFNIKLGSFGFIPDELEVMASQQMDIKIKETFIKNPYQINEESPIEKYIFDNDYGQKLTYDPELILHVKAPSILFKNEAWARGYSPLASAILASKTLRQEYISRLSLVRDRGSMGMVVGDGKSQTVPDEEQTKAVYERLKKFGLGDGKTNSYAVTNASLKWMQMSFNSAELELLKGREENLKVLARKFNVPTDLLIGDSSFNNQTTAGKTIYTSNVIPWFSSYQNKLNEFIGLTQRGEVIMPVYDDVAELQQDLEIQTKIMVSQYDSGIATKDEARIGIGRPPESETDNYKKEDNTKNNSNETE